MCDGQKNTAIIILCIAYIYIRYVICGAISYITSFPSPFVTYLMKLSKLILTTDLRLRGFCWEDDENAEKAI